MQIAGNLSKIELFIFSAHARDSCGTVHAHFDGGTVICRRLSPSVTGGSGSSVLTASTSHRSGLGRGR